MTKKLEDVLFPLSVDKFINEIWGAEPRHLERGDSRFCSLLSWDGLNRILERDRLDYPRLRLSKEGKEIPKEEYMVYQQTRRRTSIPRLNISALHAALGDGAMLVLDAIDQIVPSIENIALDMEELFCESVQVNAYAGWKTTQGFSMHWDDHDVIVLQLHGCKDWRIFPQTREFPLYRDVDFSDVPKVEPLIKTRLRPGDVLYIPRGWWHDAMPCGEPTLHLTFGVNKRTGIDYLEALVEKMRHDPFLRKDLPRFGTDQHQREHLRIIKENFLGQVEKTPLTEYFMECDALAPARARPSMPWPCVNTLSQDQEVEELRIALLARRRLFLQKESDEVIVKMNGKKIVLAGNSSPIIELLLSESSVPMREIIRTGELGGLGRAEIKDLIFALINQGFISATKSTDLE